MEKFIESVLRLHEFSKIKRPLKQDSFWNTEFSDEEFGNLKNDLAKIDGQIFKQEESHWKYTIDYYSCERDEERNN